MRLDSRSGLRGILRNRDTEQIIRFVRWAVIPDDPEQPGEFEAFRSEPEAWKALGFPLSEILYRGTARLQFIPAAPRYGVRPSSQRDLDESLTEARARLVEPKLLVPGEECMEPDCHRLACWKVSDEVEIEPQRDEDGNLYERAVTTRVRIYCHRHFRLPTCTNTRGVQSEIDVETRPA